MGWFVAVAMSFGGLFVFDSGEGAGALESLLSTSISSTELCQTRETVKCSEDARLVITSVRQSYSRRSIQCDVDIVRSDAVCALSTRLKFLLAPTCFLQ